jgi:PAS domain S-box-containing protein
MIIGSASVTRDPMSRTPSLLEETLARKPLLAEGPGTPDGGSDTVAFEELFNLDEIQRLQDEFARATGVASIITRTDGTPITRPSEFCRLCSGVIRQTAAGLANCHRSDARIGRLCQEGPTIQPCLSGGLWDAGAGITVGGRHIANWLIGQVRDDTQSEEKIRAYARAIGADVEQAVVAFREVPCMTKEQFAKIAQALFTLARQLSDLAYRNVQQARAIAERKEAEARMLFHAQVLDNVNEAVVVTDLDGRILYWGRGAEKLYGYRAEEVAGQPYRNFAGGIEPLDEARFKQEVLRQGSWHGENVQRRRDGTTFWSDVHISVMRDSEQSPVGFIGIDHDITAQKQAEAERERLRDRTAEAQKLESLGRLAGGIAHDFNNLLTVILGYAEQCREQLAEGDPGRGDLDQITSAGVRAAGLTRQLLAFARKQVIVPRVLDVNRAVSGTLDMLRRLIGENVALAWEPAEGLWPVLLDPGQLDQLLTNLCLNARDAIVGSGKITIATENATVSESGRPAKDGGAPGDYVILSVSDTGVGIDAQTMAHIFEPFFTTKQIGKGTGLGLATVHGIVKQNQGWIAVRSEPWQGATFRIHLPRAGVHEAAAKRTEPAAAPAGGSETILLAEDNEAVRGAAERFLTTLGYRVLSAPSADEALRAAADFPGAIHLLLTDVVMPGLSGHELALRLLQGRPGVKCLYMSGHTADIIAKHGVLEPGVALLHKPFTRDELASAVRALLGDPARQPQGA